MELPDDWWTTEDVAHFLDVATTTVRAYVVRGQAPPPDRRMGRMMLWRPETIRQWNATRRQRGFHDQQRPD